MDKNPPSAQTRVGFYFLLLLLLMYVKRTTINVLKSIMIVIASFTSMVPPPFEGKPRPPKFQLYLYYICNPKYVQVFFMVLFLFLLTFRVSENVFVFTNPRTLSPNGAAAMRLGLQGCPPESTPSKCLGWTEGRMARCVNTVLYEGTAHRIFLQNHCCLVNSFSIVSIHSPSVSAINVLQPRLLAGFKFLS
jgi:hypothetical protein